MRQLVPSNLPVHLFLSALLAFGSLAVKGHAQAEKPVNLDSTQIREENGKTYLHTSVLQEELGLGVKELKGYLVVCSDELCVRLSLSEDCIVTEGEEVFISLDSARDALGIRLKNKTQLSLDAPKPAPLGGRVEVGQVVPDFVLPSLNGKATRLSDFAGKRVLLVCWASW